VPQIHPPFDPELKAVLDQMPGGGFGTVVPQIIPAVRAQMSSMAPANEQLARDGAFHVEEIQVPGPAGAPPVSLLVIRPAGLSEPVPGLFYVHGGGMILGGNRDGVAPLLDWSAELGVVLISVEYRLAPEHPHPAPAEDAYAGLTWAAEHAEELGVDPQKLVIMGMSAGGGIAAACALMARDRGGPALAGQLLACPMLDDRNTTPSSHELHGTGAWDRESNLTGWTALLGDQRGAPDVSPYAAPARATDLSGLPPAFIDVGSVETFRDEDLDYAARIWRAGGDAELHVWPGAFHGFTEFAPQARLSRLALAAQLEWLRRLLSK
jgi:acetyl esterase/lipase